MLDQFESGSTGEQGTFLTQDPIGLAGGTNLYEYAGSNPVAFADPFGLCPPMPKCLAEAAARMRAGAVNTAVGALAAIGEFSGVAPLFRTLRGTREDGSSIGAGGRLGDATLAAISLAPVGGVADAVAAAPARRILSARVLRRAGEAGDTYHNFPAALDHLVLTGKRTAVSEKYVLYEARGTVNGVEGTYQIGVRPSESGRTEVITHRFFKPD